MCRTFVNLQLTTFDQSPVLLPVVSIGVDASLSPWISRVGTTDPAAGEITIRELVWERALT
jgi:hypothetical protein